MIDGNVVLVTGAGSGLGRETARQMADAGASLVLNDLGVGADGTGPDERVLDEVTADLRDRGADVHQSFGDVTDFDYVESLVDEAVDAFGRIDGAVNYAGFLRDNMCFKMDKADWDAVVDVHLDGHFNLIRHLGAQWRRRSKSEGIDSQRSFVSVSSAAARGNPSQINYSAAKAGILGLTRTAARDLRQYNVRVNAMMPVAVTRGMEANVPPEVMEDIPTERLGPEYVPPLPIALISDRTADITGWTFAIGGETVYTVTDPEFDRTAQMADGWTPESLGDELGSLVDGNPAKTDPGGLITKILESE